MVANEVEDEVKRVRAIEVAVHVGARNVRIPHGEEARLKLEGFLGVLTETVKRGSLRWKRGR